jgi:hypothetical protein
MVANTVKTKGNQPVQSIVPMVGMLFAPYFRLCNATLQSSFDHSIVIANLPGLRPQDVHRLAFLASNRPHLSEAHWVEADVSECDASHDLSDKVFLGKILRLMLPKSKRLRRTILAVMMLCDSAWRSVSIVTRQNSTHRGALPSGVPWTFLANSVKVIKHVALDFPSFIRLVVGGDDSAMIGRWIDG